MNLTEFLLARIAEDERSAQEAAATAPGHWASWNHRAHALDLRDLASPEAGRIAEVPFGADEHIARHDPARVLAECEAKRRIVEAYGEERARRDAYQSDEARAGEDEEQAIRRRSAAARCRGLEIAVELLAIPYADHEAYDPAWRP